VTAKMALIDFYRTTGRPDKSVPVYEDLLKNDPSNAVAKRALASVSLALRSYDQSLKLVDELLKADAKDGEAIILRGQILLGQGKRAEAVTELQKAINVQPNSTFARYLLGRAYYADQKWDQAASVWTD